MWQSPTGNITWVTETSTLRLLKMSAWLMSLFLPIDMKNDKHSRIHGAAPEMFCFQVFQGGRQWFALPLRSTQILMLIQMHSSRKKTQCLHAMERTYNKRINSFWPQRVKMHQVLSSKTLEYVSSPKAPLKWQFAQATGNHSTAAATRVLRFCLRERPRKAPFCVLLVFLHSAVMQIFTDCISRSGQEAPGGSLAWKDTSKWLEFSRTLACFFSLQMQAC